MSRQQRWEEFIRLYKPAFLRWCRRRGVRADEQEDVAHNIVVRVIEGIRTYDRAKGKFRQWLKAVAHNAITDYLRTRVITMGDGGWENLSSADSFRDLDEELDAVDPRITLLWQAIEIIENDYSRPPREHRTWVAFEQTQLDQRPPVEVCAELGMSRRALDEAVRKVKQRLREEYRRLEQEYRGIGG